MAAVTICVDFGAPQNKVKSEEEEIFLGFQNHQHQERVQLQLALHLLLPRILQLYHFSPPLFPSASNSSCQPLYPSCCHVLLSFSRCYICVSCSAMTLCNPTDGSPLDSSVHGILQLRILEWVAIPFFIGSSQPRDKNLVSCISGRFFIICTTGKSI